MSEKTKELRLNSPDSYDNFTVLLDKEKYPVAYANKVKCLMLSGLTKEEIEANVNNFIIEMEFYYEVGVGLMAVESEAAEAVQIYSPYTKEEYLEPEE